MTEEVKAQAGARIHRCWEDYSVGERFVSAGRTITESDIVAFSGLTGDYYPVHIDEEFAKASPFGSRIAHGPLTFSYAIGLVGMSQVYGDSVIGMLGVDELRALAPVRIGDTIRVDWQVTETRETKRADRGVVAIRYRVINQKSESVMEFKFTLMCRRGQA